LKTRYSTIFCHPIAKELKRRMVVVLKQFNMQEFDWVGTAIVFSSEEMGLKLRFTEKGHHKINGFRDVFGPVFGPRRSLLFSGRIDNGVGVGCYGGSAFLVYRFLNKHLCLEHINSVIIKFFTFKHVRVRKNMMTRENKLEIEIKNSPISKLKITMNGIDFKTIKIYEVIEKCIF
jgi:hypothetical protein